MSRPTGLPALTAALLAACLATAVGAQVAPTRHLVVDPSRSSVTFLLDAFLHKVEGSATVSSGDLQIDAGAHSVTGTIIVDATSAETGSPKRDRRMHEKVLESATYPEIAFVPRDFDGELPAGGKSDLVVRGTFRLLDGEHEIEVPLTVTEDAGDWHIEGELTIPYVAWGLENPSRAFLRVAKEVAVHLDLAARSVD